ncbi:hypothetical protein KEM52_006145 [Ascosphaera acerosa]|nr:hypothetical protein KEM52_006145 [Ascosphaera acerosa]
MAEQQRTPLRLGSTAPNFKAVTTKGEIDFHEYIDELRGDDFTPVCTTELGAFAKLQPEFAKRNTKLIGLSANTLKSHHDWVKDIDEVSGSHLSFPIIADADRAVSVAYDMLDYQDATNVDDKGLQMTIRSVFIIDPAKKIRLILTYPASTGRNTDEVMRCLDALQLTDKNKVNTGINWKPGDEGIVQPVMSTEDAKAKFGEVRIVKPYLRYVKVGDKQE